MARQLYVNLPIKNLDATVKFFTALGFGFNPQFSNEHATCMITGDDHFVMLLTQPFFAGFTDKPIADATRATEVLLCLSCDSRAQVDEMVRIALAEGGTATMPAKDHGFMYQHGFTDLDGHMWELAFMDMSQMPQHVAEAAH